MARPRQFDPNQALDAAMTVFWRHGYHASSLQMLLDAMEMNRGSLYAAFGDKASLFQQAMNHYQRRMQTIVLSLLNNQQAPVTGIRQTFEFTVLALPPEQSALGCLLVNAVNELRPLDEPLANAAADHLARVQKAFVEACHRAHSLGQLKGDITPVAAGHLLMTTMTGLRVQARQGACADELRQSVTPLMKLLFTE